MQKYKCGFCRTIQLNGRRRQGIINHYSYSVVYDDIMKLVLSKLEKKNGPATNNHCQYCINKVNCKAILAAPKEIIRRIENVPEKVKILEPDRIETPEEMAWALSTGSLAVAWNKAIRKKAYEMSDNGVEIPGYYRMPTSGGDEISGDLPDVWEALAGNLGVSISQEEFKDLCDINLKRLIKLVQDRGKFTEHEAKEEVYRSLDNLITSGKKRSELRKVT